MVKITAKRGLHRETTITEVSLAGEIRLSSWVNACPPVRFKVFSGGYNNAYGTAGLFDDSSNTWSKVSESPALYAYYGFSAVGFEDTVYTFGGKMRNKPDYGIFLKVGL